MSAVLREAGRASPMGHHPHGSVLTGEALDPASAFTGKSVVAEVAEISLAASMIRLGARLQLLLSETSLSRERLSRLYREIRRELPPKGMLPFSADWHMTWMPNIHSSVFYNIYQFMLVNTGKSGIQAQIEAYRAYVAQMYGADFTGEPVLSFTRAWMMVRFFEAGMLQVRTCSCCGGQFVAHAHDAGDRRFVCGLCRLPPRAGKRRPVAVVAVAAKAEPDEPQG